MFLRTSESLFSGRKCYMRTVQQLYDEYKIIRGLREHQLRVGGVAQIICEHLRVSVDAGNVVLACLFHDMGNVVKFEFESLPEFFEPEGVPYWKKVQAEFIEKYGADADAANKRIARDIGLPSMAVSFLDSIGFSHLDAVAAGAPFEQKICSYADMRVGPYGVLSLKGRLAEGRERYSRRKHKITDPALFDAMAGAAQEIERQVFFECSLAPNDITDDLITPLFPELLKLTF